MDTIKPPCYGTLLVNLFFGTVKRTVRNIFVKIGRNRALMDKPKQFQNTMDTLLGRLDYCGPTGDMRAAENRGLR